MDDHSWANIPCPACGALAGRFCDRAATCSERIAAAASPELAGDASRLRAIELAVQGKIASGIRARAAEYRANVTRDKGQAFADATSASTLDILANWIEAGAWRDVPVGSVAGPTLDGDEAGPGDMADGGCE